MSFKELLDKYKAGSLTEEDQSYVESEIEKNEAINEYLADELDLDLKLNNNDFKEDIIDNNKIKESINKKLRSVIAISVLSVFIIIFLGKYIVSPLVDSFYYNPTKCSTGEYHGDIYFDMRSYIELYLPGYALSGVYPESLGFGKYNILIKKRNLFNKNTEKTTIYLSRNKNIGDFENLLTRDFFFTPYDKEKEIIRTLSQDDLNYLKGLPSTSYVAAYVDFNKDLSMDGLFSLMQKFQDPKDSRNGLLFKWAAIRVAPKEKVVFDQVGFNPNLNDGVVTGDNANSKKYPYLELADYLSSPKSSSKINSKPMASAYETHFKSLLQYLYDREEFTAALDKRSIQGDFYKSSLEYVKENGVKTYGVLVYGEAKDIISFMEDEITDCIFISDIKVSKYSR